MANSQNGGAVQYGNLEPLADYPDARVLLVEEALPLIKKMPLKSSLTPNKLQKTWPIVESSLREYGVLCTLDLVEGNMTVSKTKGTQDEDIIFKAVDVLQLLSRSVPADWAIRILDCSSQYEIIKIGYQEGGFLRYIWDQTNCSIAVLLLRPFFDEQFLARRKLVISVLQGLLDLTGCGIFLKGNTIAVLGSLQGIKMITRIVGDCIAHDVPPAPRVRRLKKEDATEEGSED
ncbi:hypothetical protein M0R45_013592 [Rubus argutus]|uniref:KRR-R motif-containing protein 1 n=1 Tax=Rubus argutus TaxID=59490 RepID=A0AAW1XIR6_RUBAR